ncbi:hypothetical protein PUNSTDRAFT_52963 [Punctularia strigosozonata HHB-11173 SS5]|uniref:uncharacterized protein n=1 Tax=Punctularia strigosozonata (strain HHB-11173) TaxID=741275 RepID=UPI00044184DF|nr:uncharacterized protein PUNSTDRAFT_52963 [Punctularia strigosozonata HHB-11173 SS5]EIN08629.1 hypothetical protein PUNSTDRAFT_52963 [Punctularia strigosozonata HHB-11173 SS5]
MELSPELSYPSLDYSEFDSMSTSETPKVVFSHDPAHALRDAHLLIPGIANLSQFEADVSVEMRDDGWVVGPKDRLLLWVPPEHRQKLWLPPQRLLIPASWPCTTLDLSDFSHGTRWTECYDPTAVEPTRKSTTDTSSSRQAWLSTSPAIVRYSFLVCMVAIFAMFVRVLLG